MTSENPSPRVFVSSVIKGFEDIREAARQAIERAGGTPVLVNEDFPSLPDSPRNACLDAVDSCDIYVGIIGQRGGWETPSGKLVVEEEFDRARTSGTQAFVFLQDTDRDPEVAALAHRVSDYVSGRFRVDFDAPDDLKAKVEEALIPIISGFNKPATPMDVVQREVDKPSRFNRDASLRFVLAPSVQEEVINPVELGSDEFKDHVYSIGLKREAHLFTYQQSKNEAIEGDALIISQDAPGRGMSTSDTRISINESGHLVIDINLSSRSNKRGSGGMSIMTVPIPRVRTHVEGSFLFASELYDQTDTYERHVRFGYSVALMLGHCVLVEEEVPNRSRVMMGSPTLGAKHIKASEKPRTLSRSGLRNPAEEIDRIIARFSRKVTPQ